jgi:hypothetical protein
VDRAVTLCVNPRYACRASFVWCIVQSARNRGRKDRPRRQTRAAHPPQPRDRIIGNRNGASAPPRWGRVCAVDLQPGRTARSASALCAAHEAGYLRYADPRCWLPRAPNDKGNAGGEHAPFSTRAGCSRVPFDPAEPHVYVHARLPGSGRALSYPRGARVMERGLGCTPQDPRA